MGGGGEKCKFSQREFFSQSQSGTSVTDPCNIAHLIKPGSSPAPHVVLQSHVILPEIQELMLTTITTTKAAKRDHVARGQQQHHTGKVMSDCYNTYIYAYTHTYCIVHWKCRLGASKSLLLLLLKLICFLGTRSQTVQADSCTHMFRYEPRHCSVNCELGFAL
jgi:hypothetical protein